MRPNLWHPPLDQTPAEQAILGRIRRAKLFVFLRDQRHLLFSNTFPEEPPRRYPDHPKGYPPTPSAQLTLATLLHAYTSVSDDEVIEAATMDRRWQIVLNGLECQESPFSNGTLVGIRQRLIVKGLDRRFIPVITALLLKGHQEISGIMRLLPGNSRKFQVILRCQHRLVCRGSCWHVLGSPGHTLARAALPSSSSSG